MLLRKCVCVCVFREDQLIRCHREKLHSQDVHLPVFHSLLITFLCGLLPGQVLILSVSVYNYCFVGPVRRKSVCLLLYFHW